jgi:hypothetical protein
LLKHPLTDIGLAQFVADFGKKINEFRGWEFGVKSFVYGADSNLSF